MDKPSENRFLSMGEVYDQMTQLLVPQYDFLQDEMITTLAIDRLEDITVVDLGAGSGIMLEKMLDRNKTAKCYWVDYSNDFLEIAKERLSRFGQRVAFVLSSMENSWENDLRESPNFILSMSAIHHLETQEKKALYHRCFDVLRSGGWLVNIDEMKTLYHDAYVNSLRHWVTHVERSRSVVPEGKMGLYEKWKDHFANWKSRNLDNADKSKSKGDDLHESFIEQMKWLREAGFRNVDVFLKYHLWCAIGGRKV